MALAGFVVSPLPFPDGGRGRAERKRVGGWMSKQPIAVAFTHKTHKMHKQFLTVSYTPTPATETVMNLPMSLVSKPVPQAFLLVSTHRMLVSDHVRPCLPPAWERER